MNSSPTATSPGRRRSFLLMAAACALPAIARAAGPAAKDAAGPMVEVWKSPTCGCCKDWIAHMQANGFAVKVNEIGNTAMRQRLGVDMKYGSCHTALVGGYALEGHVPAAEVRRLLKERPAAVGLSVPGMVIGTPGMDGPDYNGRRDPFDVLLLTRDGRATVYKHYAGGKA